MNAARTFIGYTIILTAAGVFLAYKAWKYMFNRSQPVRRPLRDHAMNRQGSYGGEE